MKRGFLLGLMLSTSLFANNPKESGLESIRHFASQIIGIHADQFPTKEAYLQKYRDIIQSNADEMSKYLLDRQTLILMGKDKRLSEFFYSGSNSVFTHISSILSTTKVCQWTQYLNIGFLCGFIPDSLIEQLDSSINSSIQSYKFSNTTAVTMLLSAEEGVNLDAVPKVLRDFLEMVLEKYFDALNLEDKRSILSDVLHLDADAAPEEVLGAILNHCGPILQKAFQLFSKDVKSEKLTVVLNHLRQNIKAFPSSLAKEIIEKESKISIKDHFSKNFPDKPLAAATIGQVYLLKNKVGDKVIVKVQRPGVLAKSAAEFRLLRSLTKDSAVLKFIDDLEEALLEELNFLNERDNIHKSEFYMGKMNGQLLINEEIPEYKSTEKVLFLSCADGQSIDKWGPEWNEVKKELLKQLLYVWIHEAIFGSHIFHADLHPGNIFLDINEEYETSSLTLIDFGSIGEFTPEEAKALFRVLMGITYKNVDLTYDGLSRLAKWKDGVSQEDILKLVEEHTLAKVPEFEAATHLFDKCMELGILLPKSVVQFYRGHSFLEKQIRDLYLQDYEDEEEGLAASRTAITSIFKSVFRWDLAYDLWFTASGVQNNDQALLDNDMLKMILKFW